MIDEKLLEELAADEFDARMVLEGLASMNTSTGTYEERKQQAIDYVKAKVRHKGALLALDRCKTLTWPEAE